jgi:hypothetical protein
MLTSAIKAVSLERVLDGGKTVSLRIEIDSWVLLRAGKIGGLAMDAARHGGLGSIDGCYKGRIVQFRLRCGGNAVAAVLVQHAYIAERSGLKRNGAKIGAENDRYVDEDGTLIAAIRWRRSDDITTVIDGEAEVEAPFSRQRTAALLRSRSRGNILSIH